MTMSNDIHVKIEGIDKVRDILQKMAKSDIPSDDALRKAASAFARWASVRSNPNGGSRKMVTSQDDFEKLFFRPILYLPKLVRNEIERFYPTAQDQEMLRQGYLWKVVKTRGRHWETMGYFKTKAEAEKLAFIETRGMLRVMWGLNIDKVGGKVPKEITDILQENPNLLKWSSFNEASLVKAEGVKFLELVNKAPEPLTYKEYIKNVALPYAWKAMIKATEDDKKALVKDLQSELERRREK